MKSKNQEIGIPEHASPQLNKIRENWVGHSHDQSEKRKAIPTVQQDY